MNVLIPKSEFIGLDGITHLAAGGETPALHTHRNAVELFLADKAKAMTSRQLFSHAYRDCKQLVGQLFNVPAAQIAFTQSASDGINILAYGLDWQPGDNVIVADVEFSSDTLIWTRLADKGVEVRIVRHNDWRIEINDIAALMDKRTRLVAVSHVSYYTGQRLDLSALSQLVRSSNALLLLDATHAAGAVAVDASLADVVVSSCYKWLLGTHGLGLFYWNRERLPDFSPPFLGWHSCQPEPTWQDPLNFQLKPDGGRFEPGNPNYMGVYILSNALNRLLSIGIPRIESYVLQLSGRLHAGLIELGYEPITPAAAADRAGNVCLITPDNQQIRRALQAQNILVWGGSRIRISTHLYNSTADVDHLLSTIQTNK